MKLVLTVLALLLGASLVAGNSAPAPDSHHHRSQAVLRSFQRSHPCPSTGRTRGACHGWVKDHVIPLGCGGPDTPANLQWQTVADAKAKDRRELNGCRRHH